MSGQDFDHERFFFELMAFFRRFEEEDQVRQLQAKVRTWYADTFGVETDTRDNGGEEAGGGESEGGDAGKAAFEGWEEDESDGGEGFGPH